MKCVKCGADIGEEDKFCPNCGSPVRKVEVSKNEENTYTYERPMNQKSSFNQQQNNYARQNQSSNGDTVKTVAITVLCMTVIIAIIVVGYFIISGNKKDNGNSSINTNQTINNGPIGGVASGGNVNENNGNGSVTPVVNKPTTSAYKVNYKGFKYNIPDDLQYEIDYATDWIYVGDTSETWLAQLKAQEGSFQKLKQNRNMLSQYMKESFSGTDATVSAANVETVNGVEFIVMELSVSGEKMLVGYVGLNSMNIMTFTLQNMDNDFNREYLKDIATIAATVEYTGESTYLKSNDKIDMKKMEDVLKKIAE